MTTRLRLYKKLRRAIMASCVTGAVLLSGLGLAMAQTWQLAPRYGSYNLNAGFMPDPQTISVVAGGPIRTGLGGCSAYVANNPDIRLHYTAGSYPLNIYVRSGADTTLLVNLPNGQWACNDDSQGLNPLVSIPRPASGQYDIFVGTFNPQNAPATIHISERAQAGQPTGPRPVPQPQPQPPQPVHFSTSVNQCQAIAGFGVSVRVVCGVHNDSYTTAAHGILTARVLRTSNSAVLQHHQNIFLQPGEGSSGTFSFPDVRVSDQGIRCQCNAQVTHTVNPVR